MVQMFRPYPEALGGAKRRDAVSPSSGHGRLVNKCTYWWYPHEWSCYLREKAGSRSQRKEYFRTQRAAFDPAMIPGPCEVGQKKAGEYALRRSGDREIFPRALTGPEGSFAAEGRRGREERKVGETERWRDRGEGRR